MTILFKKDGLYEKDWVYNEETDEGKYVETKLDDVLTHWYEEVEGLEEGLCFHHFIKCMFPIGINKTDLMAYKILLGDDLAPFLAEAFKPDPKKDSDDPVHTLEIYNVPEATKYHKDTSYELTEYWGCHGYGRDPEMPYSMSWSNWGTFIDLPIVLKTETELVMCEEKRTRKHWWNPWSKKTKRNYKYTKIPMNIRPTLGDLLHDVFLDLCFCCTPEKRDAKRDEINGIMDEINDGTAELVELDLDKWMEDED